MNKREFIKRAIDSTNGFGTFQSEAQAVNPNIWDIRLREFEEANLIITPQAEQFDFRSYGTDYKVTIDEAPSAAAALVETTDVSISAFTTRPVTFTPTEYGAAYQLSRKEAVRAFFNVADRMVRKLGYSMALKKDQQAVSTLYSGAGTTVIVNKKAATSSLASTDTIDYDTILRARRYIRTNYYRLGNMFISPIQEQHLLALGTIHKANEFGTRDAIQRGLIGELFGVRIFVSDNITASANVTKAIMLGVSQTGEQAFGYAIKRDPIIEREYFALGRYWNIVGHEEYDFQVLHPQAVVLLASYT